jgi:hypothetical protein
MSLHHSQSTHADPSGTELTAASHRSRMRRSTGALLVAAAVVATITLLVGGAAGAQESTDPSGQQASTTVVGDVGPVSDCSPGHIVRRPDCGIAPESATDPGGWLQVSLFYLISGSIIVILAGVWWRSRKLRDQRRAAGLDPLTLAKAKGQGTRRSTLSEPVAATSSNKPDANAGR